MATYSVLLGDFTVGADEDAHDSGVSVTSAGMQCSISVLLEPIK